MPGARKAKSQKEYCRECFCQNYDVCLTYAAKKNLRLNCSGCEQFKEMEQFHVLPPETGETGACRILFPNARWESLLN
ncbi:MAG: hypothetical protein GY749_07100 [Desulfobacteraceae bacterium]|nr:hypothetical protein [Desulfobacteraceae bacterium]